MKTKNKKRYDLPGSRILIRSLRCQEARTKSIVGNDHSSADIKSISDKVLQMVLDMFVVRLMEDKMVLPDRYLVGGKRSRKLSQKDAVERLSNFNQWLGWDIFHTDAWSEIGPGDELSVLDHELHLSRFWPSDMPIETLGALWEERLPVPKRAGVFYTPKKIVEIIIDGVFTGFYKERHFEKIRLLDPACGSAYFLLAALRKLVAREIDIHRAGNDLFAPVKKGVRGNIVILPERRMEIFGDCLFGVDIDEFAIGLARRALMIEILSEVRALDHAPPPVSALFNNLKVGDSILEQGLPQQVDMFAPETPPPLKPFNWNDKEDGFGEIMESGGFNCIVGNPPWVSLKGRHRQPLYTKQVVKSLIQSYDADTYRPNIAEFFIRRSIGLLENNGWHGFVVPDRIAENSQYDSLRKFMAKNGEIKSLHFREPFPGVAADTLIYIYNKRNRPRSSQKIIVSENSGDTKEVKSAFWLKGAGVAPVESKSNDVENILSKIETSGRRKLEDFLETGVGFISRPRIITKEKEHDLQQPVVKGEHITPYRRTGSSWFEFTLKNLAGGTRNVKKLTQPNRILLRKTGARLVASRDESKDFPEQSLYFAFPKERRLSKPYDIRYFLGILNSKTMSFYFRHRKITNKSTTPQIKKMHLDSLPIRPINFNEKSIKKLHNELVLAVKQREQATDKKETAKFNKEIEQIVATLYNLNEKDMKIINKEMVKGWD